jgi:hypothetical protein
VEIIRDSGQEIVGMTLPDKTGMGRIYLMFTLAKALELSGDAENNPDPR